MRSWRLAWRLWMGRSLSLRSCLCGSCLRKGPAPGRVGVRRVVQDDGAPADPPGHPIARGDSSQLSGACQGDVAPKRGVGRFPILTQPSLFLPTAANIVRRNAISSRGSLCRHVASGVRGNL